ncbi:MAG TPA: phosphatidate cytidylyltransferase [Longimicrobiaceae bacterium]|nr:phosphatidate cytidylyltransferase [Longimicrobiaceae bacterium]
MPRSETATRVAVAAVGIPVAIGAVVLGGWVLAALLGVVAVLAALEFSKLAAAKGPRPLQAISAAAAAGFVVLAALRPDLGPGGPAWAGLVVLLVMASIAGAIWLRGVEGQPVLGISATVFGALYTGALLAFGLYLRHLPGVTNRWHGTALLFAPVLLTWSNDSFAYFVGRRFGRRKLIPRVSPGKTVEGTLGALVGTILVAVAYSFLLARFPAYRIGVPAAAAFGAGISIAAVVGDLAESLLKRDAGVKDSGTLLPGHGGALDRFDSLFFTLPLAYYFFRYVVGAG